MLEDVVRTLVSKGGLRLIQDLVENAKCNNRRMKAINWPIIFRTQILPFLEVVTAANVIQSPVLETAARAIYNALYGVSGRRGLLLLPFLADLLSSQHRTGEPLYHLELSLVVFWHVIKHNPPASIHENFKFLAIRFEAIFKDL